MSVNVPGRPAYAVYVHELRQFADGGDEYDGGFPAFVSLNDPNDVDIQWQDATPASAQISDTMDAAADKMGNAEQTLFAARAQMATEVATGAAAPFAFGPRRPSRPPPTSRRVRRR
jgi:hypothetical protein